MDHFFRRQKTNIESIDSRRLLAESKNGMADHSLYDVPERQAVDRGVVCDIVPLLIVLLPSYRFLPLLAVSD